jgi:hypothetical protein
VPHLCAEAVWWRYYRRIVTDCLLAGDETVFNVVRPEKLEAARMTPTAWLVPGCGFIYPPHGRSEHLRRAWNEQRQSGREHDVLNHTGQR